MRILLIDNAAGGCTEWIDDVERGMTLGDLFRRVKPRESRDNYTLRVNRNPADDSTVLRDSDRVSMMPNKIEGA